MSNISHRASTMTSYRGCENCSNFFTSKHLKCPSCKVFGGVNDKLLDFIGLKSAEECKFYEKRKQK